MWCSYAHKREPTMKFMTPAEIATQDEQQAFREELAEACALKGWTLREVFYSDKRLYVNPDDSNYSWDGEDDKPRWVRRYLEKHKTLDAIRVMPRMVVLARVPD